jgi:integrase
VSARVAACRRPSVAVTPHLTPHSDTIAFMAQHRSRGEGGVHFEHRDDCKDPARHRNCKGRWRGELIVGHRPGGREIKRRVSGRTKTEATENLKELQAAIVAGLKPAAAGYTLDDAAKDWLASLENSNVVARTIRKNLDVINPLLASIGEVPVRDLEVTDVERALKTMAASYASSSVIMGHNALDRTLDYAMARKLIGVNVSKLTSTPRGLAGRPSKAMTREQVAALLAVATGWLKAYIALSVGVGLRTEEARALTWSHVQLDATPPHVEVWRSVRASGETKTQKSRRTLALPRLALDIMIEYKEQTSGEGLVFATASGGELDPANVRRAFRKACKEARIGDDWTPRELRHSGISLLSLAGLPIEEVARIAGHATTVTTQRVYRRELRPVLAEGAAAIDKLFG